MIIGISGKIRSGKDTVASMLQWIIDSKRLATQTNGNYYSLTTDNYKSYRVFNHQSKCEWVVKKFAIKLKTQIADMLGVPIEDMEDEAFKNSLLPDEWQVYTIFNWGKATQAFFSTEEEAKEMCLSKSSSQSSYTYLKSQRTVRWFMQDWGTRAGRGSHENIWINSLFSDYDPGLTEKSGGFIKATAKDKADKWIVTDVRFLNEIIAIKKRKGIVIRVERDEDLRFTPQELTNPDYAKQSWHPSETELDHYDKFNYRIINNSTLESLVESVERIVRKEALHLS